MEVVINASEETYLRGKGRDRAEFYVPTSDDGAV
jgi:hypothetical protein